MSCGVSSAAKFEQNFERMCPRTGISKVTSEYCNSGEEKDDHVGEVDLRVSAMSEYRSHLSFQVTRQSRVKSTLKGAALWQEKSLSVLRESTFPVTGH